MLLIGHDVDFCMFLSWILVDWSSDIPVNDDVVIDAWECMKHWLMGLLNYLYFKCTYNCYMLIYMCEWDKDDYNIAIDVALMFKISFWTNNYIYSETLIRYTGKAGSLYIMIVAHK